MSNDRILFDDGVNPNSVVSSVKPLPVTGGSAPGTPDSKVVTTQGIGYSSRVSFNRPADTSAYTAGDVIGTATGSTAALIFANAGPAGGGEVIITTAKLEIDIASIPSGMTGFMLYLYSVTPPSALGDNAAFDIPSGDRASFLQPVNLGAPLDLGSTLIVVTAQINQQITVASGGSLFGYLVTIGGYTPAASSTFVALIKTVGV